MSAGVSRREEAMTGSGTGLSFRLAAATGRFPPRCGRSKPGRETAVSDHLRSFGLAPQFALAAQ